MSFFDDIRVGDLMETGSYTFSAEAIRNFAAQFDPQPFHLDEEAGRRSLFGGLTASCWHTASVWMKLMVAWWAREAADLRARGEPPPVLGPSPGFRDMKWPKPVLAGDTVSYMSEVTKTRASASQPGWGIIEMHNTGTNQRGELVFSFTGIVFVARRSPL